MLYDGAEVTLERVLTGSETVKAVLLRDLIRENGSQSQKIYLVWELPNGKPEGLGLPGGTAEDKETVYKTVFRELAGETGYTTEPRRILYVFRRPSRDPEKEYHYFIVVLAEVLSEKKGLIRELDEIDPKRSGWFDVENLPNGIYHSHVDIIANLYRDGIILYEPYFAAVGEATENFQEMGDAPQEVLDEATAVKAGDNEEEDSYFGGWTPEAVAALAAQREQEEQKRVETLLARQP